MVVAGAVVITAAQVTVDASKPERWTAWPRRWRGEAPRPTANLGHLPPRTLVPTVNHHRGHLISPVPNLKRPCSDVNVTETFMTVP